MRVGPVEALPVARGFQPPEPPPVEVTADAVVVTPGRVTEVRVRLRNRTAAPLDVGLRALGTGLPGGEAERRLSLPVAVEIVCSLDALLPVGTPAGRHRMAVVIEPPGGHRTVADLALIVLDHDDLTANLVREEPRGGGRARTVVEIANRSAVAIPVTLSGTSPGGEVRLARSSLVVPAGATVRIRARVIARQRLVGARRRIPFMVGIEGAGPRRQLLGTFDQRPLVRRGAVRLVVVLAVLAIWIVAMVLAVSWVRDRTQDDNTFQPAPVELPQPDRATIPQVTTPPVTTPQVRPPQVRPPQVSPPRISPG
ncbi:hypothetical protein BH20ACT2_BH20ACT2_14550 [soil metagenome]